MYGRESESELTIILYPSIVEIENTVPNLYMGGLGGFHDSVRELREHLSECVQLNDNWDLSYNYEPASLLEVGIGAGLCAAATAVYKILKAWAELQNGRKIKVHFGPQRQWQIETTQLSIEQFVQLVNALSCNKFFDHAYEKAKATGNTDKLGEEYQAQVEQMRTSLIEQGVNIVNANSDEAEKDEWAVRRTARKQLDSVRESPKKPRMDTDMGNPPKGNYRRNGLCAAEPRGDGGVVHAAGRTIRTGQRSADEQSAVFEMGRHLQGSDDDGRSHRSAGAPLHQGMSSPSIWDDVGLNVSFRQACVTAIEHA